MLISLVLGVLRSVVIRWLRGVNQTVAGTTGQVTGHRAAARSAATREQQSHGRGTDVENTGSNGRDGWPERLREARMRRFRTTWQAAKALSALDPRLPNLRQLHRYWAERWETGRIRPSRTYRELIEQLLDAPGLFTGEMTGEAVTPASDAPPTVADVATLASDAGSSGSSGHTARAGGSNWAMRPHSVVGAGYHSRAELRREVSMAAEDAAENAATADTGIGERTLTQLQEDMVRQARDYPRRPLAEVFRNARQTRDLAARRTRGATVATRRRSST